MPALGKPAARCGGIPAAAAAIATDWLTVGGGGAGPASPADIIGWPRSPRHLRGGGGGGGATDLGLALELGCLRRAEPSRPTGPPGARSKKWCACW